MSISQACYRILEEISRTIDASGMDGTDALLEAIPKAKRVFVTGAGRSGLMIRAFGMRLMQIGVDTYVVGETTTPSIAKGDLLIVGSGSGSTGGPLSFAQIAQHMGAKVAGITAAKDAPLKDLSDILIWLPAPTPKVHEDNGLPPSAQPLGSLFEQTLLVYLDALIILLMRTMNVEADTLMQRHATLE
jgi:6-phospho-3-hexuloisomerase